MKTQQANARYMKKHIAFFIFMMLLISLIFLGKAKAQGYCYSSLKKIEAIPFNLSSNK